MINTKILSGVVLVLVAMHLILDFRTASLDTTRRELNVIKDAVTKINNEMISSAIQDTIEMERQRELERHIARLELEQVRYRNDQAKYSAALRAQIDSAATVVLDSLEASYKSQLVAKDIIIAEKDSIIRSKDIQISQRDSSITRIVQEFNVEIANAVKRIEQQPKRGGMKLTTVVTAVAAGLIVREVLD